MNNKDTIVSIATPMGTGAISVIRCSGSAVKNIIDIFFKKKLMNLSMSKKQKLKAKNLKA